MIIKTNASSSIKCWEGSRCYSSSWQGNYDAWSLNGLWMSNVFVKNYIQSSHSAFCWKFSCLRSNNWSRNI